MPVTEVRLGERLRLRAIARADSAEGMPGRPPTASDVMLLQALAHKYCNTMLTHLSRRRGLARGSCWCWCVMLQPASAQTVSVMVLHSHEVVVVWGAGE